VFERGEPLGVSGASKNDLDPGREHAMNVSRRHPARLVLAFTFAAVVLVIGAVTAFGQDVSSSDQASTGTGISGAGSAGVASGTAVAAAPVDVVAPRIIAPGWCCGTSSSVPGLTTAGQATLDGQDQAARDDAIAAAVQDATAQANAAVDAAGIQLGAIIDLQVFAMPYLSPRMMGGVVGSPGVGREPAPDSMPYVGSVSVTITWALG
jgi:uncharacterized protein YggE